MGSPEGWPGIDARRVPTGDGAALVSNASYAVIGLFSPRLGMEKMASLGIVARAMAPIRLLAYRSMISAGGSTARSDRP